LRKGRFATIPRGRKKRPAHRGKKSKPRDILSRKGKGHPVCDGGDWGGRKEKDIPLELLREKAE